MTIFNKAKNSHSFFSISFHSVILIFSFFIWCYLFRGYLSGEFLLELDAKSYYENFKFFLDNLSRGVYPLWNPETFDGMPNDFFLRRIGEHNPFYYVMAIAMAEGVSFSFCYFSFLAGYFFLGIIGFYRLSILIFKDKDLALVASLLLMFSGFAGILFKSFLILLFVPMVWFFVFLLDFVRRQSRMAFLGMILTLMITSSTYIPFYFLTIFLSFLIFWGVVYRKDVKSVLKVFFEFMSTQRLLFGFSVVSLILALIPGVTFFWEVSRGDMVFPVRHLASGNAHALTVNVQSSAHGGLPGGDVWQMLFGDWKNMTLGRIYVPLVTYILFLLGFFTRVTRLAILFVMWFTFMFLLCVYDAGPIYQWLYKYVFYFKYFRNFHFFIWLILIPLFILLSVEQLKVFLAQRGRGKLVQQYTPWKLIVISFVILAEPVWVFSSLHNNAPKRIDPYTYDKPYLDFSYLRKRKGSRKIWNADYEAGKRTVLKNPYKAQSIYFGTSHYNFLRSNVKDLVFYEYMRFKFLLYDAVEVIKDAPFDAAHISFWIDIQQRIQQNLATAQNRAFVSAGEDFKFENVVNPAQHVLSVESPSEKFKVLDYNVNHIRLKTNFSTQKFLVFNDNYYKGWRAFINDQPVTIWRSNIAYKGISLPRGENVVLFRYGSIFVILFNYVLTFLIGFILFLMWRMYGQEKKRR